MNLFSEKFGSVDTREGLAHLQSQHSVLDPGYISLAAFLKTRAMKAWIESWWKQFEPYADPNFPTEFKTNLAQRCWELYIGVTLLNRGYRLGSNGVGQPDFDVQDRETMQRLTWIEAIAVEKGTGNDRVPDTELGKACGAPTDQILLRLANGLVVKHRRYLEYVEKGIVQEDEPFVIAIIVPGQSESPETQRYHLS